MYKLGALIKNSKITKKTVILILFVCLFIKIKSYFVVQYFESF
jgi:uncharacterized membrane protein YwzB